VDDLIAWAKGQVEEARNWNCGDEVAVGDGLASHVNSVNGVSSQVEMLLWSNDVDVFSIVDRLADEWHILQTKNRKVHVKDELFAQNVHGLKIESSLSEDRSDQGSFLQEWSDLRQDLILGVSWRTDNYNVSIRHHIFGLF
jgi:hypothetical protein